MSIRQASTTDPVPTPSRPQTTMAWRRFVPWRGFATRTDMALMGAIRPRLYALLRRWPAALGFGVAALTLSDFDDGREFAIVLLIASVGYLAIAMLDRPRATWWVLIGLLASVVCLRLLNIAPEPVLAVAAVAMTIVGLVRGSLRRLWLPALQAPATLLFGTVAFIAVAGGSEVGNTLVAAGLLTHSVWDVIHLRARAIVSPSLAEWCAVLDTLIAVGILVLVWA